MAAVAISCFGCRERRNETHEKPEVISDTVVYEPTFLSRKLQDSLDAFIAESRIATSLYPFMDTIVFRVHVNWQHA